MRPQNLKSYADVLVDLDNIISELERLGVRPGRLTQMRDHPRCLVGTTADGNLSGLTQRFGRFASDGSPDDAGVMLNLGWRRISSVLVESYEIANIASGLDPDALNSETLVQKWRAEQDGEERCRQAIRDRGPV